MRIAHGRQRHRRGGSARWRAIEPLRTAAMNTCHAARPGLRRTPEHATDHVRGGAEGGGSLDGLGTLTAELEYTFGINWIAHKEDRRDNMSPHVRHASLASWFLLATAGCRFDPHGGGGPATGGSSGGYGG